MLLLGDSLGDLTMADGAPQHQNLLTVGFLNDQVGSGFRAAEAAAAEQLTEAAFFGPQVDERKESYANAFDVVLVRDETMDVPNAIVRFITSPGGNK